MFDTESENNNLPIFDNWLFVTEKRHNFSRGYLQTPFATRDYVKGNFSPSENMYL